MKDLPHHIKKLNKDVVRKAKEEELPDPNWEKQYRHPTTEKQKKKQKKAKIRKLKNKHTPHPDDAEEQNKKMKHRTPVRKERSHKPPNA